MDITRRRALLALSAAGLHSVFLRRAAGAVATGSSLGLNTWSLRYLNHDEAMPVIVDAMRQTGLTDCQLVYSHAEPVRFDPGFGRPATETSSPQQVDERKRRTAARNEWLASVPMSYFEDLRVAYSRQGVTIRTYIVPLPEDAALVGRVLQMGRALGATLVNSRIPEARTDVVAAAAQAQRMQVGIQVTDVRVMEAQLRASPWLRADPDIGDLTKAGIDALAFVREHLPSIAAVDLKDAMVSGPSVPFGTGQAHMAEVLAALQKAPGKVRAYIDCDYPGTGRSAEEVVRSVRYVRGVLG